MDCITNIFALIIVPLLTTVFNMIEIYFRNINRREEPEPEITEPEITELEITELEITELKIYINECINEKDKNV